MTTQLFCDACAEPADYLDWNDECPTCARGNPQERVAIALHTDAQGHQVPWAGLTNPDRDTWRERAHTALQAAIDERELAEHIGPIHAEIVRIHLLGGAT